MLTITRRDIDDAYSAASAAHRHVQGYKATGESVVGQVVQSLEVSAGAFGVGLANGYYGALHIQGSEVPLDLAGSVLGHLAGFFGLAGKYSEHLHNISDGVLAAYTTKVGIGVGTQMRAKKGLPPVMTVSGSGKGPAPRMGYAQSPSVGCSPNVGAEPLTEAELAAMAHSVR